jgi:hypothetical protein
MSNEDHKILKDARKWAPDLPEGRDAFYEAASINSALLPPDQRLALIEYIDSVAADEGNLRGVSQLLALKRKLTEADAKLKRAGR